MTRVAIVGGHGKIARELSGLLSARGDTPLGVIRNPEHAEDVGRLGAEAAVVDLEQSAPTELERAFAGADAVVFAAGAGPDGRVDRKQAVDLEGSRKSVAAATRAGVPRFVQISAISADRPVAEDASDVWRAYIAAKRDADAHLRASSLAWTILRPGRLTDDPANGTVTLRDEVERDEIPRADVAALIVAVLDEPGSVGKQWEVVRGPEPIADAVSALV